MATIELTEEKMLGRSWRIWMLLSLIKVTLFILVSYFVTEYVTLGIAWGEAKFYAVKADVYERLSLVREVVKSPDEADLYDIIQVVSKEYDIDPLVLDVLKDKESSGGKFLYRFEPDKFQSREKLDRRLGLSDDERRMLNSSHGVFHVMGYTARDLCGLHWSNLYDSMTSARCAATILSRLFEETKGIRTPGERLREVFRRYNGSGPSAEAYADDAMSRIAQRLYRGVVKPRTA